MGLNLQATAARAVAHALEGRSYSRDDSYRPPEEYPRRSLRRVDRLRVPTSRARRIMLAVIVHESDWVRARAAIMRGGCGDVEVLRVVPVARTSDLRVHIGLQSAALGETMSRIMRSLKAAEFGAVTPVLIP